MLFDVKQFEHFFKEKTLKKGLKLFEKGALELVERHSGFEYHFFLEGDNLLLRKRGDRLMNYTCSCLNIDYCEHLSAAMFYFQQEALGISVKSKNASLKKKEEDHYRTKQISKNLKKAEQESLLRFVKEQGDKLTPLRVSEFLSGKATLFLSDVYSRQIELLLRPYVVLKYIDQKKTETLHNEITSLVKKIKKQTGKEFFYLYLGIVKACLQIFQLRFTGNEKPIFDLYDSVLEELDKLFLEGLNTKEKTEWFNVTLDSVETNKNLLSKAFTFFVPRFVTFAKNEKELLILSATLKKRVFKTPYSQQFDLLLIARFQAALKEWKLFKTAFPLHQEGGEVELIIAKAELELCKRNFKNAFTILETHYEEIRLGHKSYYKDYLTYIILNARKNNLDSIELKYLRESFIYRLFIIPEELERFLVLIPKENHAAAILELTEAIKSTSKGYYFEKLSLLLLRGDMLDELIRELSRANNKFTLVHEIALKKFPECAPSFLTLYMRHLAETLRQDSIYKYQLKVFNTAKEFLDRLPEETVIELIKKLLDQIGKTGHLYRHINELYDYPFLKEEGNY